MRHEEQVRLIKQLETHLDAGTNVDAGGLMRNPTSVYMDPELAEREWNESSLAIRKSSGFRETSLLLGRS